MNPPVALINRADVIRELDQLLINQPFFHNRRLIGACKERIMELEPYYLQHESGNIPVVCPFCSMPLHPQPDDSPNCKRD